MNEKQEGGWLCSVVYVGRAEPARSPEAQQDAYMARLRALIDVAVSAVRNDDRFTVETRDGVALCFLSDPEDALTAAVALRERVRAERPTDLLRVRIGVHLGMVRVPKDPAGRLPPVGDGLDTARHVMSLAEPDQILASRPFFDMISSLSPEDAHGFRRLASMTDGRAPTITLYQFVAPEQDEDTILIPEPPPQFVSPSTEVIAYSTGWERAELTAAAMALEPYVGTRARALVKEAAERATSVKHLYQLLAESLPAARDREEFCRAQGIAWSGVTAAGVSVSPAPPVALDPALLETVERQLAMFLGPLARVLVKQHARGQSSADQFLSRLAEELAVPQRRDFLDAVRKARGKL